MLRRLTLLIGFMMACTPLAQAQTTPQAAQPPMPKPLMEQRAHGAQVYYLGKYDVLESWAMIRGGQPEFYYATPGNNALVMGLMFDGNGDLRTGEQLKALELTQKSGVPAMMASQLPQVPDDNSMANLPAPDAAPATRTQIAPSAPAPSAAVMPPVAAAVAAPAVPAVKDSPAEQLFADVQSASGVLWGQAGVPTFFAFLDPNCPHCQYFIREIEPSVNAGLVAVHIIPVGFDSKSKRQAAFVLGAGDGPARLAAYAKGDTAQLPAPEELDIKGVEANALVLTRWNLRATPMILYRAGKTGEVKIIRGRPLDTPAAVADLRGQ